MMAAAANKDLHLMPPTRQHCRKAYEPLAEMPKPGTWADNNNDGNYA